MAEYVPYPKWLHFEGEQSVLVQDEADHAEVIAARPAPAPMNASAHTAHRDDAKNERSGRKIADNASARKAESPVYELDSLPAPD